MPRNLSLLVLFLLSSQAWGATWYVRPGTSFGGTNAGTSYANAWQDWSNVVWASLSAGDTLIACGTFSYTSAGASFVATVAQSGSAGSILTIDGNCSASGDLSRAVIYNNGTRGNFLTTNTQTYITIKNIEITGFTNHGLWLCDTATCDQTVTRNIIATSLYIHEIQGNAGASPNAIKYGGKIITISDSVINNCGDDCIFGQGTSVTISGNTITGPSVDTATGDCFQTNGQIDGLIVSQNSCSKTADVKQCYVVSAPTDSGLIAIKYNTCVMPAGGTTAIGIYTEAPGKIFGNIISGGADGIHAYTAYGTLDVWSNIVTGTTSECFGVGFGSLSTDVNFFNNSGANCGTYGIALNTNSTTSSSQMNAISGATECYWEYNTSSAESYDDFYNCTTAITQGNTHTSGAVGTGTITSVPGWVGGTSPTTAAGFKLKVGSALRRAGTSLNIGAVQDYSNRAFHNPPSIGAYEVTSGQDACTRGIATTRALRY